jgi:hypothetical protein
MVVTKGQIVYQLVSIQMTRSPRSRGSNEAEMSGIKRVGQTNHQSQALTGAESFGLAHFGLKAHGD